MDHMSLLGQIRGGLIFVEGSDITNCQEGTSALKMCGLDKSTVCLFFDMGRKERPNTIVSGPGGTQELLARFDHKVATMVIARQLSFKMKQSLNLIPTYGWINH